MPNTNQNNGFSQSSMLLIQKLEYEFSTQKIVEKTTEEPVTLVSSNPAGLSMSKSNKKKWLKVIEFAVVGIATWLNPSAGGLLFLLKLCFQILAVLQKDEEKTESADEEKTENVEEKQ